MQEAVKQRMSTGISSLDPILDGGVPPGSVILLLGDLGAGNSEFVYSSMVNNLDPAKAGSQKGQPVPKEICYVTFTRVKEDIKNEILQSFHVDGLDRMVDTIRFEDLSEHYFDHSVVPDEWYSHSDVFTRLQKRTGQEGIIIKLSKVIDNVQPGGLVVLDSDNGPGNTVNQYGRMEQPDRLFTGPAAGIENTGHHELPASLQRDS